jgi:GT2 family glycosyltransferase
MIAPNITLATVTYGDRLDYVTTLVNRVLNNDIVKRVIIVNNGSQMSFTDLLLRWESRIVILNIPRNMGSAFGYKQAISRAIEDDSEYIWLMDDDNLPQIPTLSILMKNLETLSLKHQNNNIAVVGFRPDHFSQVSENRPVKFFSPPHSSFMSFSVMRQLEKILFKVSFDKKNEVLLPPAIEIPYAPYGGFLAHKNLYVL